MIKLNNKNITYVALADSNNSLKAPKEIWYADSSNSVKLVYRRKDALIEGEDYEKYHWLDGDGSAYIDTNINLSETDIITTKFVALTIPLIHHLIYGDNSGSYNNTTLVLYKTSSAQFRPTSSPLYSFTYNTNTAYETIQSATSINVNGTQVWQGSSTFEVSQYSCYVFATASSHINYMFDGKISKFIISDKINLIPCKLLKPVPKWLDANGIRRQVGECGMIDIISGKFYGNVNSVGTFTVENYYERKEWLVGDGMAFLNTKGENALIGINSVEWELSGNGQAVLNSFELTTGAAQFVSDLSYVDGSIGKIGIYDNNRGYFWTTKLNVNTLRLVSGTTINAITINDVDLSNPNYQWSGNFILQFINRAAGYKVSKVTVDGSVRYVPCTLTMDLPASMDANNIARTKGTSGMWDLVSDRFYGNVANSGTFKAVNLADGVDYEVHQWLKVELVETNASMMTLPVNSYSFAFSRKPLKGRNVPYFITEGNDVYLYSTTDDTIRIWNQTQYGYYYSGTSFNWGDTISIVSSGNGLEVNSQVIPQNTFPCKYVYFGANDVDGTENYTSSITVDGIERYIPVKLLRSIPSKYDANGIARQAGECGMYDTVNDVFYGNVASSGSFTVEDDN